ncbi:Protein AGENET DOMAIN (AGD)-CONTAINING P1, partial [Linum perenne]
ENPSHYVVHYDKLFEEKSGKIPLQKNLHWVQLRPAPPPTEETKKFGKFNFGNEFEAFHEDGWWEGIITEELTAGKFVVFFLELQGADRVWGEKIENVVVSEPKKLVRQYSELRKFEFSGIRVKKIS